MRIQKLMRLGKSNTECLLTRLRCIHLYEHWASFCVNSIQPKLIGILVDLLCSSFFFLFLSEYHKKYNYNSQWESARKRSESQGSTEPDTVLRFVRLWERWKFLSIPHIGVFFCGKDTVKRTCVGIWNCRACRKTVAGGAYTLSTPSAIQTRSNINRLRRLQEDNA